MRGKVTIVIITRQKELYRYPGQLVRCINCGESRRLDWSEIICVYSTGTIYAENCECGYPAYLPVSDTFYDEVFEAKREYEKND